MPISWMNEMDRFFPSPYTVTVMRALPSVWLYIASQVCLHPWITLKVFFHTAACPDWECTPANPHALLPSHSSPKCLSLIEFKRPEGRRGSGERYETEGRLCFTAAAAYCGEPIRVRRLSGGMRLAFCFAVRKQLNHKEGRRQSEKETVRNTKV